jgi:hypothetical protein
MFSDVFDDRKETPVEMPPNGNSLDLLRAVYCNPSINLQIRIRCAVAALPFEFPKLAVTAVVNEQNFAEALERRLRNMERINKGNGRTIEAKPVPQVETKPQMPRVADRRFRRI